MLNPVLEYIFRQSATQQKKIEKDFIQDPSMAQDLEKFLEVYQPFMSSCSITVEDLGEAYISLIEQMLMSRLDFIRTGKYCAASRSELATDVYDDKVKMTKYMLGLALSLFLWKHHYKVFNFYKTVVSGLSGRKDILEIGSGHGLFTLEVVDKIRDFNRYDVVDISGVALDIARNVIASIKPEALGRFQFIKQDINSFVRQGTYDVIIMCEVLEHLEQPQEALAIVRRILSENGVLFLSTCANSPAIDHFYHFKSVNEIIAMITGSGFSVVREVIVPAAERTSGDLEKQEMDIIYAAELRKLV